MNKQTSRRTRRSVDAEDHRESKTFRSVQMVELSAGRAALEAAEFKPGFTPLCKNCKTLCARDANSSVRVERTQIAQNLRSARKSMAPSPSQLTCEHFRLLLDNLPRSSPLRSSLPLSQHHGVGPRCILQRSPPPFAQNFLDLT